MLDIIIEEIIEYITEELGGERRKLMGLIKSINFDLKRSYPLQRKKYHEYLSEDIRKYKSLIDEIKEIRETFQKGKPFVNNQTKGKEKQLTIVNMRLSTIKFILKYKGRDLAIEEARKSLDLVKSVFSERSYYRLKKKIRSLGIEI